MSDKKAEEWLKTATPAEKAAYNRYTESLKEFKEFKEKKRIPWYRRIFG